MESYTYTFYVSEWNDIVEDYISGSAKKYNLICKIERNFLYKKEIIVTFWGKREYLREFELKFFRGLSRVIKIDSFTKLSVSYSLEMLKKDNFFDISQCDLRMYISSDILLDDYKEKMVKLLKAGKVGLIKNFNGYYLVSVITKTKTVKKVRDIAHKPTQTLPILVRNTYQFDKFVNISKKEKELLQSPIRPIMKIKKRHIHRLEKVKNRPVNVVSFTNFYDIKLPKNKIEETLSIQINQPLIFLQVDMDKISKNKVDFILTAPKSFLHYPDTYMQFIYGRENIIKNGYKVSPIIIPLKKEIDKPIYSKYHKNIAIAKENKMLLAPYEIDINIFLNILEIKDEDIEEIDLENVAFPVAKIHRYLSGFQDAIVFDFNNYEAKVILYKDKKYSKLYQFEQSIKDLFDKVVMADKKLKEIYYENESQLIADSFYEICHEEVFKYSIKENISIDIDLETTNLSSTLINTISHIVMDISKDREEKIVLCGEIFENKNLTENIIEFFENNNKDFYLSDKVPLSDISAPLGILLDKCNIL